MVPETAWFNLLGPVIRRGLLRMLISMPVFRKKIMTFLRKAIGGKNMVHVRTLGSCLFEFSASRSFFKRAKADSKASWFFQLEKSGMKYSRTSTAKSTRHQNKSSCARFQNWSPGVVDGDVEDFLLFAFAGEFGVAVGDGAFEVAHVEIRFLGHGECAPENWRRQFLKRGKHGTFRVPVSFSI